MTNEFQQGDEAMKATRAEVYAAIDSERAYQDAGRGNAARHGNAPPVMEPGAYILCMEECLTQARAAWYTPNGGTNCLPFVRKVAALGVACMEHYGAPPRDGIPARISPEQLRDD